MPTTSTSHSFTGAIYSLIGHLIFFTLIIIFEKLGLSFRKDIPLNMDQYAMQVDIVGMPDKTLKEIALKQYKPAAIIADPVPAPAPTPTPPTPSPEPTAEKPNEKSQEDLLLSGLKEWNKKEIPQVPAPQAPAPQSKAVSNAKQALDGLIFKGNKLQAGGTRPNLGVTTESPQLALYLDQVIAKIRLHWKLPSDVAKEDLKCRIRVALDAQGRIQDVKVIQSSGDPSYDQRAKSAIMVSAPFNKVPMEILKDITTGSFVLGFPL